MLRCGQTLRQVIAQLELELLRLSQLLFGTPGLSQLKMMEMTSLHKFKIDGND